MIDADTPRHTRVILNNPARPFYLAAGTVTGPSSDTAVKVRFDLKPNKTYPVPVADLDLYREGDTFYGGLDGDDPPNAGRLTFTGVPSIVRFFREYENVVDKGKWALTGSTALAAWAHHYGVEFRDPQDIDVVVRNLSGWWYYLKLAVDGSPGPPSMTANHRTLSSGMFTIDILADGQGLGEIGAGTWEVDGMPLVGLDVIKKYKSKRGNTQDIADIEVADTIAEVVERRRTQT